MVSVIETGEPIPLPWIGLSQICHMLYCVKQEELPNPPTTPLSALSEVDSESKELMKAGTVHQAAIESKYGLMMPPRPRQYRKEYYPKGKLRALQVEQVGGGGTFF